MNILLRMSMSSFRAPFPDLNPPYQFSEDLLTAKRISSGVPSAPHLPLTSPLALGFFRPSQNRFLRNTLHVERGTGDPKS